MLRYHIDLAANGMVYGWAFDDSGQAIEIEAWRQGQPAGRAYRVERPDVTAAFPKAPKASGFEIALADGVDLTSDIEVRFKPTKQSATVTLLQTGYARFLRAIWAHFLFVRDYFPRQNRDSSSERDACAVQNSPEEMFAIANHLYVLKANGIAGDFAEFGCFKGYSTSMLSYACQMLGLRMHVFDSFEGLPPSEGSYYVAGQFKGGLEEVQANVRTFGAPDVVTYHKGFFGDVLPRFDCPPLISLWMDVDLESSARDVMTAFRHVDPRGAVFSHECDPHSFVGGVHQERDPNHVIPPVIDAYAAAGAAIEGRHVYGSTGAFWRRGGIPVMANDRLLSLLPKQ